MRFRYSFVLLVLILTACGPAKSTPTIASPTIPPLAPPQVFTTKAPDVQAASVAFLTSWQEENYQAMYDLLTPLSRDAISLENFTKRYTETADNLSLESLSFNILSTLTNPTNGQVSYRVTFKTVLLGTLQRDMAMNLVMDNGNWKVQWEDSMILPELRGGNHLALDVKVPVRGSIYDKANNAIATQQDAVALGVLSDKLGKISSIVEQVSRVSGVPASQLFGLLNKDNLDPYVPLAEAPQTDVQARYDFLSGLPGLVMNNYTTRYYANDGVAPHVTGYVLPIPKEQVEQYQRKGYRIDEKIGSAGLEKWGDNYLAGVRGASLYVVDSQGQIVTRISQNDSQPSMNLYTTIDHDLQIAAQRSLGGFRGAVVAMELNTGRVLAMASSPDYDPNAFDYNNYNSNLLLKNLFNNQEQPLLNRATQGGYPLGSVFKIITMSAALESGLYTADTTYNCGATFTELPDLTLYDWTVEFKTAPSGLLTLPEGLMRSCNPFFWHIGLDLFRQNRPNDVSNMARAFGLGSATGIGQVAEDTGSMPDPANEGDAVQEAIGQGTVLVTPLQVVDFVAAVGNGGTLYKPQIVEKIASPNGDQPFTFKPEVRNKLPLKPENLKILQDAMLSVVVNPRGTAHSVFLGTGYKIYGKTGTAQNPFGNSHAWFAGYTAENRTDKPDIAVVVIAENAGEGSEVAAPIFRRIIEYYFDGKPSRLFPWESQFFVTRTPLPTPTNTNTPGPSPTPEETATPTPG